MSPFLARLMSALNGTEYWVASWIAIFTIERFGRRKLMIFGAVGMSMCMAVLTGTTSSFGNAKMGIAAVGRLCSSIQSFANQAQTVMLFAFNSFFAVGWLGMTWLYPAEITPLSIRAPANAIS